MVIQFQYEALEELFSILKVKNNYRKHWIDGSGWGMAETMHYVVLTSTKVIMQVANYFSMNTDEVTTLDSQ
jgi:hypothetical protein